MSETEQTPKPTPQEKPEKCQACYYIQPCMLTRFMVKSCGGPFKDMQARLKYYEKNIKEQKKMIS